MIDVIASNFHVKKLATRNGIALLGALRSGGTEVVSAQRGLWITNTAGVWHLLFCFEDEGNYRIGQWHIPRYLMATALDELHRVVAEHPSRAYRPVLYDVTPGLALAMFKTDRVGIVVEGIAQFGAVKRQFMADMEKEREVLAEARALVRKRKDTFALADLEAPAGNPVSHRSEAMIEAIAFETLTVKNLEAGNFGVFSAFCTLRDFCSGEETPDERVAALVEEQLADSPSRYPPEVMESLEQTQARLVDTPFWNTKKEVSAARARASLSAALRTLTPEQRAQLSLMNGMHSAAPLLALSTALGDVSFEDYTQVVCAGMEVDSPEEQDRRKEAAYIALFRRLAGHG